MPNPTVGDVHIQAALGDISVAYTQSRDVFVAGKVVPTVPVVKQSDKYFLYTRQDWFRADAQPRAPGTESAGGGFRVTNDVYFCDRVALHMDVSDPERANCDPAVNLDVDATEYITEQILLKQEIDFVTFAMTTASGWLGASNSTNLVGQAAPASTSSNFRQWNDVASTPIEDIRGEMTSIAKNTGRKPNTLILGPQVWTALADHPDVLDRIKYTERGVVTTDLLASLLDLEQVVVMWAVKDSATEGRAGSYGFAAGKAALLAYFERAPGLRKPTAAYKFVWTMPTGAPAPREGARIKRFRMEHRESDRIEGEAWYVYKQVATDLGAFFASAVA